MKFIKGLFDSLKSLKSPVAILMKTEQKLEGKVQVKALFSWLVVFVVIYNWVVVPVAAAFGVLIPLIPVDEFSRLLMIILGAS